MWGPRCGSTVERPPCGSLRRVPLWVFNCGGSPVGGPCGCVLCWGGLLRGVLCGGSPVVGPCEESPGGPGWVSTLEGVACVGLPVGGGSPVVDPLWVVPGGGSLCGEPCGGPLVPWSPISFPSLGPLVPCCGVPWSPVVSPLWRPCWGSPMRGPVVGFLWGTPVLGVLWGSLVGSPVGGRLWESAVGGRLRWTPCEGSVFGVSCGGFPVRRTVWLVPFCVFHLGVHFG